MTKLFIKRFVSSRLHIAVTITSLLLNLLFAGWILLANIVVNNGELDTAIIQSSINKMCSDEYRYKYEGSIMRDSDMGKKQLALLDYNCAKNGAGPYYEKGYNEYIRTLGLNP